MITSTHRRADGAAHHADVDGDGDEPVAVVSTAAELSNGSNGHNRHPHAEDGDDDGERKDARPRRRRHAGPIDCPMCLLCSFEDALWWTVAFVAVVILVNYAYANLAPYHRGPGDLRSWLGTKSNDPGGCHCQGDSFGEFCKGVVGRTKIYLPSQLDALRACQSEEFRAKMDLTHYFSGKAHIDSEAQTSRLQEAEAIEEVLQHLQDPVECFHGATQFSFEAYSIPSKLSLPLALAAAAPSLSSATRAAKGFQFLPQELPDKAGAGGDKFCKASARLACLLEPTSTCGGAGAAPERRLNLKDPSLEVRLPPTDLAAGVPSRFKELGAYWYYTQLLKHMWKPNEPSRKLMTLLEEGLRTRGKPMVCAYISNCRQADIAREKLRYGGCLGSHTTLDRLMPSVGELGLRYNISTVFLVSDTVRSVATTAKYDKFDFKHLLFSSAGAALQRIEYGAPPPPAAEWLGGAQFRAAPETPRFTAKWASEMVAKHPDLLEFAELEMMSRCTAFVGPFSQPGFAMGYQLAVARHGYFPPYISTDKPLGQLQPPRIVAATPNKKTAGRTR